MALSSGQIIFFCAVGIIFFARPAHAFGAGNIGSTSKIEGQNWRHGDLEDTLLTLVASKAMGGKKFSKLDVKRVYFGNWLRDYSQAVDVGTVKAVSAEAIRILLWVLGFMSFGYGSGEFEVTTDRLGCYRPEEHIDNPKDYADNIDARQYDRRLRGPVDERIELAINPETGLKNYIASERMNIDTSAGLIRRLFGRCIQLGRQYARNKNKKDLYEALRLLGTGCHCLEDYAAHSNYVELALIEMGERDIFPHVGRRTAIQLRGARSEVYPIVTGTFGGVDFLHSVCGEFDDKTTQSEIQELEGTLQEASDNQQDGSVLQDLFNKVPDGVFGGKDEAGKADELQQNAQAHQMQSTRITPRQPEEWTRYINDAQKQIYPIIEWHDEVMQSITETIEKIPILPDLIDSIQDEVNKFVFSLLAPYVVPIINQVKNELNTGSNEIIQSSMDKQHIVFNDDHSSDPTHSMLSKDHFSNILNEPAGKVARQTVAWIVPQLIHAWDDEGTDVERTINRIIHGVLHHPALRDQGQDGASDGRRAMFGVVEKWWREKSDDEKQDLRQQLSRRGVEQGQNHKQGVKDHGHGSGKPLGMANLHPKQSDMPIAQAFDAVGNTFSELTNDGRPTPGRQQDQIGKMAGEAVGGGLLGGIVGGIASAVGKDMLGGGLDENKQTYKRDSYGRDGSRTETLTQVGQRGDRYGQAQYSRTEEPSGRRTEEYNRYEQTQTGGGWQAEVKHERRDSSGRYQEETKRYGGDDDSGSYPRREETTSYSSAGQHGRRNDDDDNQYGRQQQQSEYGSGGYGGRQNEDEDTYGSRNRQSGGYGEGRRKDDDDNQYGRQQQQEYSSGGYGSGRRDDEDSGYGGRQSGYGGGRQEEGGYGGERQEEGGNGSSGYGGQQSYGGGRGDSEGGYGQQQGYGEQQQEDGSGGYERGDGDDNQGYGRRRDDDSEYSRY